MWTRAKILVKRALARMKTELESRDEKEIEVYCSDHLCIQYSVLK